MIKGFIKSLDTKHQVLKTIMLYTLNLWDIIFTQFFLFKMPSMYEEVNPMLAPLVTDIEGILLKVIVPFLIIIYWNIRYPKSNPKMKRAANIVICTLIFAYTLINLLHVFNTCFYMYIR